LPPRKRVSDSVGELSTILLAKELGAALILMDEESGRWLAREEGLEVRRTLGIVERLYQRKEIADLREAFQRLLAHRAHLGRDLLNRRLELFGLAPL
jgi:predicted nucleic acid-binding protein